MDNFICWITQTGWPLILELPWGVIIASIAAVTAIWQARIAINQHKDNREHNKMTVTPILGLHLETSREKILSTKIILKNVGFGPAIVKKVEYRIDSIPIETPKSYLDWNQIIEDIGIPVVGCAYWNLGNKDVGIGKGDERELLKIIYKREGTGKVDDFIINCTNRLKRISVFVDYESIYKESQPQVDIHYIKTPPTREELKEMWGE